MLRLGKQRDELSVVDDQIGSPTYATDLANAILDIVQNKAFKEVGQKTQVYHYSNAGDMSWHDFFQRLFSSQLSLAINVNRIGFVSFCVRLVTFSIKYIIGRNVN